MHVMHIVDFFSLLRKNYWAVPPGISHIYLSTELILILRMNNFSLSQQIF